MAQIFQSMGHLGINMYMRKVYSIFTNLRFSIKKHLNVGKLHHTLILYVCETEVIDSNQLARKNWDIPKKFVGGFNLL